MEVADRLAYSSLDENAVLEFEHTMGGKGGMGSVSNKKDSRPCVLKISKNTTFVTEVEGGCCFVEE